MSYTVKQCYYDSGKVTTHIYDSDLVDVKSGFEERPNCDIYYDTFPTMQEAQLFANNARNT